MTLYGSNMIVSAVLCTTDPVLEKHTILDFFNYVLRFKIDLYLTILLVSNTIYHLVWVIVHFGVYFEPLGKNKFVVNQLH